MGLREDQWCVVGEYCDRMDSLSLLDAAGRDGVSMFEVMHRGKISGCRLTECAKNAIGDCILSDREPVAAVHAEGCSSAASLVAGHSQTLLRSR